jgi:DNA polymerase-3 subunit epsilon
MPTRKPFVAIDFETADPWRDSACRVALARVEEGHIVAEVDRLIRPPRSRFSFTHLHGLTWDHVRSAPDFGGVWPALARFLSGAAFLVAHNAPFDRSVMEACCTAHGLPAPTAPFRDTLKLARERWGLRPARLPDVCAHLGIPLARHHDALQDVRACARVAIAGGLDLA